MNTDGNEAEKGTPRRYRFKLYPSREQAEELQRQCYMVGDLWNALLQRQEDNYRRWKAGQRADAADWPERGEARARRMWAEGRAIKAHLSEYDLGAELTALYADCPEWRALSTWTGRRVARAMDDAFKAFFRRAKAGAGAQSGYPRFRPRRDQNWLPHRAASGFRMERLERDGVARQLDWTVRLKGVPGLIRAMGRFPADPIGWADADIRLEAGTWWLSVAVEMPARGRHGARPVTVDLNLVDCFARVNGADVPAWAIGLDLTDGPARLDALRQEQSGHAKGSEGWREIGGEIGRLSARMARQRREALHLWTTRIVRDAGRLAIIRPADIKGDTASGRGDEREWGAAVEAKADMNRTVLGQAPGMAIQMLTYKAAEAGIEVDVKTADTLSAGNKVVELAKTARRASRAARKLAKDAA